VSIWEWLERTYKAVTARPTSKVPREDHHSGADLPGMPEVVVHGDGATGVPSGGSGGRGPTEAVPDVTAAPAGTGGEADRSTAAPVIPPGAKYTAAQHPDRMTALAMAQQQAREACHLDAGLPTIYSTEQQRSTVDDGQGHLVPGWEVRIFFNCPPPIA
jgi:hypothetical protein